MEEKISTDSFLELPPSKEKFKEILENLPKNPGVYKFLDESKNPIYIGKAKNLKNRISSYFRDTPDKTKKIVSKTQSKSGSCPDGFLLINNSCQLDKETKEYG